MENDSKEFTLPPAPRGLCFDRNDFVKVGHFLHTFFLLDLSFFYLIGLNNIEIFADKFLGG